MAGINRERRLDAFDLDELVRLGLSRVEAEVNAFVRQNAPVETRLMAPDDARAFMAKQLATYAEIVGRTGVRLQP